MAQDTSPKYSPPKAMTKEVVESILDDVLIGVPVRIAAQAAGVSARTWRRWNQWGSDEGHRHFAVCSHLMEQVAIAEARFVRDSNVMIREIASGERIGDWIPLVTILERRYPGEYARGRDRMAAIQAEEMKTKAELERLGDLDEDADQTVTLLALIEEISADESLR